MNIDKMKLVTVYEGSAFEVLREVYRDIIEKGRYTIVGELDEFGHSGGKTLELLDVVLSIVPPASVHNTRMTKEKLSTPLSEKYMNNMLLTSDSYVYGSIRDQFLDVAKRLERPGTRSACFTFLDEKDVLGHGYMPCPLCGQFFVRDGNLSLRVNLRSVDLYNALPFNMIGFEKLMQKMCYEYNGKLIPTSLIMYIASLHVYQNDIIEVLRRNELWR